MVIARRRQVERDDAADHADADADAEVAIEAAVVDDAALAAVAVAPVAPEQAAVAVDDGDDAHAVRAHVERLDVAVGAALRLGAGAAAEALGLVVADDGAVVLLDDQPVAGLLDHLAASAVFDALAAILAHVVETLRSGQTDAGALLRLGSRRQRPSGRAWRRRSPLRSGRPLRRRHTLLRSGRPLRRRHAGRRTGAGLAWRRRCPGGGAARAVLLDLRLQIAGLGCRRRPFFSNFSGGGCFWNCGPGTFLSGGGRRFSTGGGGGGAPRWRRRWRCGVWRWLGRRRRRFGWRRRRLGGGGGGRLSRRFLLLAVLLLFLFLFLFRLGLCALDKAQAVGGDRAGGRAESNNESSSEAASTADRHVLIDPKFAAAAACPAGRAGSKTPCLQV